MTPVITAPRPLAAPTPGRRLGRFELLSELGRGAQAVVWLAHDPRLDREVALKLLNPAADADGEQAVEGWLDEARAVSRLSHPHVVPVFEADTHESQPYLVFEFVDGPTLAQARRSRPSLPPREAVTLMLGVLDALAAAHALGIVHRDLKPSNVLLGNDGRARVMDFGIAARVGGTRSGSDGRIVGTPGYMSPEAARGAAPLPAMDVFAAGVMLAELLSGAPLMVENDPLRAVRRVQLEDLSLPAQVRCDDPLRGIVNRALARDVDERFDSAAAMHRALTHWLQPDADIGLTDANTGAHNATLEFLLRRMRHKTDFPALSASVVRIQQIASSETESIASLSDQVLQDVALTNKLLRMVNTAHFSTRTGGGVSTVSRAVALVGFAGIRNMAMSVVLLEHMGDKGHAEQLKEEFLRAWMAGTMAGELAPLAGEGEDAFLAAMFQNLGRLLTEFYFPEEAQQIRQRLVAGAPDTGTHGAGTDPAARREAVARRVLGIGLTDLGAGVAKAWGLPDPLQRGLRAPEGDPPARAIDRSTGRSVDRLRWIGRASNALTDALLQEEGPAQAQAVQRVAEHYAPALGLQSKAMVDAASAARKRLQELAQAMGIHVAHGLPAQRLLQAPAEAAAGGAGAASACPATADTAALSQTIDTQERTLVEPKRTPTGPIESVAPDSSRVIVPVPSTMAPALRSVLQELRASVASATIALPALIQAVLSAFQNAAGFRCAVFCLREADSGNLLVRAATGSGAAGLRSALRIDPRAAAPDLFAVVCAKGADLLVADAGAGTIEPRLPAWFRRCEAGRSFLLLPLMHRGSAIGLLYADRAEANSLVLAADELALLRQLRDLLVAALTQRG
ncbi:MAG: HDOD domain-containing protein [Rubrivivax sp.]